MGHRRKSKMFAVAMILPVLILAVITGWLINDRLRLIQVAEVQHATIVHCDYQVTRGKRGRNTSYTPVALSDQGIQVTGSLWWDTRTFCERRLNKPVEVLIHPTNPNKNRINSFFQFWLFPVLALGGLALFVNSLYLQVRRLNWVILIAVAAVCGVAYRNEFVIAESATHTLDPATLSKRVLDACVTARMAEKGLTQRTQIKRLSCYKSRITDLSSINDLVNLQALFLSGNHLTSLETIASYPKLTELNLVNNQLSSARGVERQPALEALHLGHNQISDIASLSSLAHLKHLDLYQNQVQDISSLTGLPALEKVNLNRNDITDISPLANKPQLRDIQFYNNRVSDLRPLYGNNQLKIVGVRGKGMVSCDDIQALRDRLSSDAKVYGQKACDPN